MKQSTKRLAELGVPILAGTDVGAEYIYAGSSLHGELALLVEAGLTPSQALAAATAAPAKFLKLKDSGRIAKGMRADLVLLKADPIADIAATKEIEAVILNGRFFDRAALNRLLEEGKAAGVAE
jgi:imidazolonepropionase-like amidohydrolase